MAYMQYVAMVYLREKVYSLCKTFTGNSKKLWTSYLLIQQLNILDANFDIRKTCKIRNRYNQVPYLTLNTIIENDKSTKNTLRSKA